MNRYIKSAIIGAAAGFANGLFGSGGGTIVVPAMEKYLKIETHKAHASAIAIILPLSVISAFVYVKGLEVPWAEIICVSAGGLFGGFLGAKFLNKLSGNKIHKIFGVCMIIAALRMVF